ncbi:hypothetical protein RhiirA5_365589 [Rhizophagus irregularis]|uniref:Uncharacterized protein n=1 Tax=Rhizophagus irregularis TaxID=588596 RepID=A0A2N0P1D3_9GLOM|nr:hypothetical protein RhiirA5_365589 [Rhizophagus irregularis]
MPEEEKEKLFQTIIKALGSNYLGGIGKILIYHIFILYLFIIDYTQGFFCFHK